MILLQLYYFGQSFLICTIGIIAIMYSLKCVENIILIVYDSKNRYYIIHIKIDVKYILNTQRCVYNLTLLTAGLAYYTKLGPF